MPSKNSGIARACEHCGAAFRAKLCKIKLGHGRFCSKSCRAKAMGVGNAIRNGILVPCAVCGVQVWRKGYLRKKNAFSCCSKRCLGVLNGQRLVDCLADRPRAWQTGERNTNWRGGITPAIMKIRKSPEMRAWREAVFTRDQWTCQSCGRVGGALRAHHVKPFALHPALRFDVTNGRTLCQPCHGQTPSYGWRGMALVRRAKKQAVH